MQNKLESEEKASLYSASDDELLILSTRAVA